MGRKAKYSEAVKARAIELRGRGMVTADIRETLKREFGAENTPNGTWINDTTRGVQSAKPAPRAANGRAAELLALVDEQSESGAADCDTDMLRTQARELVALRQELKDNPSAVAQLSRALIATMTLIDKRTPPPPPPKEVDPEWVQAAEECRNKLRAELQKMLDKRGQ